MQFGSKALVKDQIGWAMILFESVWIVLNLDLTLIGLVRIWIVQNLDLQYLDFNGNGLLRTA